MRKILIAEDNEMNYNLFLLMLKDILNIIILHANDGNEAIELCDLNPDISLVLMDINMPNMNGEAAAVAIKLSHPNIPIISQTAYSITGMVSEENRWCFEDFISKPIDSSYLKKLVKKYCPDEK